MLIEYEIHFFMFLRIDLCYFLTHVATAQFAFSLLNLKLIQFIIIESCNSIAIGREGGVAPLIALARSDVEVNLCAMRLLYDVWKCFPFLPGCWLFQLPQLVKA